MAARQKGLPDFDGVGGDMKVRNFRVPSSLRGWLMRPLDVRTLAILGYVCGLGILALVPLASESLPVIFWAAIGLGIVAISSLVYSPDLHPSGSRLAAFFLVFLMHGLVAWASFKAGYYPRFLAGGYFGEAIRISSLFVLLEWGATTALGRTFTSTARHTIPLWQLASALILIVLATAAPVSVARGYGVSAGAAPARYRRLSVDATGGASALPSALVEDVFIQVQWDYRAGLSRVAGWDIKQDGEWAIDVAHPHDRPGGLPPPSLAMENGTGLVLAITELAHANEAGDRACWVVWIDVRTGTKAKAETVARAPSLGPDASAVSLPAGWQRPPLSGDCAVRVDVGPDGSLMMEGPGFEWSLRGEAAFKKFVIGNDVVVMRDLWNEKYWYHIFLLPVP